MGLIDSMKHFLLIFIFSILSLIQLYSNERFQDDFETDRQRAFVQIVQLRGGALIVRLKSQDRKIQAYRNAGNNKLADKLEKELHDFNQMLVKSFNNHYHFSKFFFIYPEDYQQLLSGETSGFFLDQNLQKDPSITLEKEDFFVCEYGVVYAEAIQNPNNARLKVVTDTPMQQDALIIKDKDLRQLLSPFPSHVSIRLRTMEKSVENLNRNLYKFFERVLERNNG
jgi:hypothetical protein